LAELSNFSISEEESEMLKKDLGEILKYVSQLDEVDVDGVEPTYQVFEMENVWRDDEILPQEALREDLLNLRQYLQRFTEITNRLSPTKARHSQA